jgi:hypothetical protein
MTAVRGLWLDAGDAVLSGASGAFVGGSLAAARTAC